MSSFIARSHGRYESIVLLFKSGALSVRGERNQVVEGKTPEITVKDARILLASLHTSSVVSLRDRALLSSCGTHFARVSATVATRTYCHAFRATSITAYLEAGGTIENAQAIAAHEAPRTTKLYNRTGDKITLDKVERIAI